MKDNEWTAEELRFNQQLKEIYDGDPLKIPLLDTSFTQESIPEKKHRKRISRFAKIAAVIMLMAASSLVTAICISGGYVEAFKDHVEKKMFVWKSGVMVTTEEAPETDIVEVWEVSDSMLLPELVELFPTMKLPGYIPDGYEFEKAAIDVCIDQDYTATFHYSNGNDWLKIIQMPIGEDTLAGIASDGTVIELEDRIITTFSDFGTDIHGSAALFDDASIQISTEKLSTDEVLKVAKEMN